MSIVLSARHEAAVIAYVALYDNCDKARCWRRIGSAIKKHGVRVTRTVYRGHARRDRSIRLVTPFFSTTPKKQMAELFVEKEWPEDEGPEKQGPEDDGPEKEGPEKEGPEKEGRRIGNFFTVHLVRALVLSTRSVRFTLSREVIRELRALNGDRVIAKGDGNYTLDEFIPLLLGVLRGLVHDETHANGEEILVLNDGAFYADPELRRRGFRSLGGGDYETWYAEPRHRVELNAALFRSCASRVMRQKRVAWPEYTDFMRRCGFDAYRDDKHGLPRVCVAPFDGAPLVRDCLGMVEPGDGGEVEKLCSAHIRHIARLMMRDRCFEVSDAFWRRNVACGGFFVLSNA